MTLQTSLVTKMEENASLHEKLEKMTQQHTFILTQLLSQGVNFSELKDPAVAS